MSVANLILSYLIIFVGGFLLIKLRAFFIFHPKRVIKKMLHAMKIRENRRSLSLALAGTLGVGNIYGVAFGLIVGGEGSVFWLIVSALFAIVIKYAESTLASLNSNGGVGIMLTFEKTFRHKWIPKVYAICICLLALTMGSFIQADSFISSMTYFLGVPRILTAVLILISVLLVTSGNVEKIKNATEIMIPLATVSYILIALIAIISNGENIGGAIVRILNSAKSGVSFLFGTIPIFTSVSFSEGFARGILSNEAGVGTSSMSHSDGNRTPATAGIFGMCEIVFDTLLLCVLTAFLVLTSIPDISRYSSPMALIFDAVRIGAGDVFLPILLVSIFLFAYSTIICWYAYGVRGLSYLKGEKFFLCYAFLFYFSIISASYINPKTVINVNDFLILIMLIPTLLALVKNVSLILDATKKEKLL